MMLRVWALGLFIVVLSSQSFGKSLLCQFLGDWADPATMSLAGIKKGSQTSFENWAQLAADYQEQGSINFTSEALRGPLVQMQTQLSRVKAQARVSTTTDIVQEIDTLEKSLSKMSKNAPRYEALIQLSRRLALLYTAILTGRPLQTDENWVSIRQDLEMMAKYGVFTWLETTPLKIEDFAESFHIPLMKVNIVTEMQINDAANQTPEQTWDHDWSHRDDMMNLLWIPLHHKYQKFSRNNPQSFVSSWHQSVQNLWDELAREPEGVQISVILLLAYFSHESPQPDIFLTGFKQLSGVTLNALAKDIKAGKLGPRFQESWASTFLFATKADYQNGRRWLKRHQVMP